MAPYTDVQRISSTGPSDSDCCIRFAVQVCLKWTSKILDSRLNWTSFKGRLIQNYDAEVTFLKLEAELQGTAQTQNDLDETFISHKLHPRSGSTSREASRRLSRRYSN